MPVGRSAALLSVVLAFSFLPTFTSTTFPAADGVHLRGDPDRGRSLFTGELRLANGGAACIACHSAAGIPGGGGVLGPDLTKSFADFGAEGLESALADIPFPTMKPVYANRPLEPAERAHVAEFLRTTGNAAPDKPQTTHSLAAASGFAAFLILLFTLGRNRLKGVRRPLVEIRKERGGTAR